MPVIAIPLLKTKFETGDRPTGADYVDLIDTTSYYAVSLEARIEALELADNSLITGIVNTNLPTVIDSWTLGTLTTVEYLVQITQGTKQYCSKVLVLANASLVNYTNYGIITIGDDITALSVIADSSGGLGRLVVQISNANVTNANVKVIKSAIT
jgi:hypothetical protein